MPPSLPLTPQAANDVSAAYDWYEERESGLGEDFLRCVEACLLLPTDKLMSIHPQIIEKGGQKEFVVLPYEEFIEIQQLLEDYEDLQILRSEKATQRDAPTRLLREILAEG